MRDTEIFPPARLNPSSESGAAPALGALRRVRVTGIGGTVSTVAFAILAFAGITGCTGSTSDVSQNDPAEPVNRAIFDANHAVDRHVMRPVAEAYQDWMPQWARTGVHNFSANLKQPTTVANDLLQGNASYAWTATKRFAINTTIGGAGVADVAAERGLAPHTSDFGQTLAVWGSMRARSLSFRYWGLRTCAMLSEPWSA